MSSGIGVVGGGQLALMLAQASRRSGIPCHAQLTSGNDPAAEAASSTIAGNATDPVALRELSSRCRAVTFEHEWLNLSVLKGLEDEGTVFYPSSWALSRLISKRDQRQLLNEVGIPCPRWLPLSELKGPLERPPPQESIQPTSEWTGSAADATTISRPPITAPGRLPEGWCFPVMAKASLGGYDGRGTLVLQDASALDRLLRDVAVEEWLLEEFIPFERELALVACRDRHGTVGMYPLAETRQHDAICDWVLAPAEVAPAVEAHARNVAASLLTHLGYVGVLAIEFFWGAGGLLVNELAPRAHNSAHYTIDAAGYSQFEQQARIVHGEEVQSTTLKTPGALMVNLLGLDLEEPEMADRRLRLSRLPGARLHWYGKNSGQMGRKLGHLNLLLEGPSGQQRRAEAMKRLAQARVIWPLPRKRLA